MEDKWKVKEVGISEVEPTEINANKMSEKDFAKLKSNIQKTGCSSVIACYKKKNEEKYVIISGNHRYKACLEIGYSKIKILYANEDDLKKDEIIALQLSHNSLHGEDDKGILKRLLDEIQSIEYKEFAHISMDDIKIKDLTSSTIVPISEHFRVSLILYKKDMELLSELFELINEEKKSSEMIILADGDKNTDNFIEAIDKLKREFNIKSTSVAFSKLLEKSLDEKVTNVTT